MALWQSKRIRSISNHKDTKDTKEEGAWGETHAMRSEGLARMVGCASLHPPEPAVKGVFVGWGEAARRDAVAHHSWACDVLRERATRRRRMTIDVRQSLMNEDIV